MKIIFILFMASMFGLTDPCEEDVARVSDQFLVTSVEQVRDCEEVHYAEPLDCPNGEFGSVSYLVTNCYIGRRFGWRIRVSSDTVEVSRHPCEPIQMP